jgi:hypothetical protein
MNISARSTATQLTAPLRVASREHATPLAATHRRLSHRTSTRRRASRLIAPLRHATQR